ncbi:MAG TPA: hypothetical protein VJP76_05590, partial [Candidatus Tumulicola sp.]|nr:hypothetical protein [Candidatus Tumulicola sp.]
MMLRHLVGFGAACGAAMALAACNAAMPSATAPMRADRAGHPNLGPSWMAPDAGTGALLYISNDGSDAVTVYSYPGGKLKGTLTGFLGPYGECSDTAGDVFIVNEGPGTIVEYAHGGTSPIATLNDPGELPEDCAYDKKTGNLAVSDVVSTNDGPGGVSIYKNAQGTPTVYTNPAMEGVSFLGYDGRGNLFLDGTAPGGAFAFAELPAGKTTFKNVSLNQPIAIAGGVLWDGTHVAVGDQRASVVYQFAIKGTVGTKVGSTSLQGASDVVQFWKRSGTIVGPDYPHNDVGLWAYPAGGAPAKLITNGIDGPIGSTISV